MIEQKSSRVVYHNRWMTVREDDVEFANGTQGVYGVVEKPDFALVVPYLEGAFYLVRQYRYPVRAAYWEFPQGSYEESPDIEPLRLTMLELKEETGLGATQMQRIGFLYEAYGYCNQGFHVFLATGLEEGAQELELSEQDMTLCQVTIRQFETMVHRGEIRDAPTISAYGLLKMRGII